LFHPSQNRPLQYDTEVINRRGNDRKDNSYRSTLDWSSKENVWSYRKACKRKSNNSYTSDTWEL